MAKSKLGKQSIAAERVRALFSEAENIYTHDSELANRYVGIARKISMKYKVKIPSVFKRRFCRHCHVYLKPGFNCRIRTSRGKVVYYCLNCKRHMRFPYIKEIKQKRVRKNA